MADGCRTCHHGPADPKSPYFGKRPVASLVPTPPGPQEAFRPIDPAAQPVVGSPACDWTLDNKQSICVLDTGAVISVVRRGLLPGATSAPSRLRLQNVNGGVETLFGPRTVRLSTSMPRMEYQLIVYEANITDDCLIGTDFINANGGSVDLKLKQVFLEPPGKTVAPDERIPFPTRFVHAFDVGKFTASRVFTVVRSCQRLEVQPLSKHNCVIGPPANGTPDRLRLAQVLRAQCVMEDGTLTELDQDGARSVPWSWEVDRVSTPSETVVSTAEECDQATSSASHGHSAVLP